MWEMKVQIWPATLPNHVPLTCNFLSPYFTALDKNDANWDGLHSNFELIYDNPAKHNILK